MTVMKLTSTSTPSTTSTTAAAATTAAITTEAATKSTTVTVMVMTSMITWLLGSAVVVTGSAWVFAVATDVICVVHGWLGGCVVLDVFAC
ncbi:hypothetical protein DER45DRAFT_575746 [Fusarium avenaceum]|nr:hypothetical protein DER45DRAFT_575746 [Fusarium avenaceum]